VQAHLSSVMEVVECEVTVPAWRELVELDVAKAAG